MSENTLSTCPKCFDELNQARTKSASDLRDAYGKVDHDEYSRLAEEKKKIHNERFVSTLAEYALQGITCEGKFYSHYSGVCMKCGFTFEFAQEQVAYQILATDIQKEIEKPCVICGAGPTDAHDGNAHKMFHEMKDEEHA